MKKEIKITLKLRGFDLWSILATGPSPHKIESHKFTTGQVVQVIQELHEIARQVADEFDNKDKIQ